MCYNYLCDSYKITQIRLIFTLGLKNEEVSPQGQRSVGWLLPWISMELQGNIQNLFFSLIHFCCLIDDAHILQI